MTDLFSLTINLLKPIWLICGNLYFLLFAIGLSLILKGYLLSQLYAKGSKTTKSQLPFTLLLVLILSAAMMEDISWIIKLLRLTFLPSLSYKIVIFFVRIGWAFYLFRYQALAIFIERLSEKKFKLHFRQLPFILLSSLFFIFFIVISFKHFNLFLRSDRSWLEFYILQIASRLFLIIIVPSLFVAAWRLRIHNLPRIIKKQLKILLLFFVIPLILVDIFQTHFLLYFTNLSHTSLSYSIVGLSTIILFFTIYYSARRVMGLRLLNITKHVYTPDGFNFMKNFRQILEQFSQAKSEKELTIITQHFFKDTFNIPAESVHLHIRNITVSQKENQIEKQSEMQETLVESFISTQIDELSTSDLLQKKKISITDELAFSNFYERNEIRDGILTFLTNINADIFIPVYNKDTLVAYIIIERYARAHEPGKNVEFYSNVERDQMIVFATYLGNIIHLLHNRNLNTLIAQEKELQEELYNKHQKIDQYKESIRSFIRTGKEKKIGIIFYKNRRFTFGNQTAQELIGVNINTHDGHPITKTLKKIVHQALEYKSQQTSIVRDTKNGKLVLSAIPNIEQNNVIVTVYFPEISDIIKKKMDLLNDPTKWDYLLYLETTKSGKLIDQLIPGNKGKLLNFKIDLLKTSLSRKVILLDMPEQDLMPTVELLHHISLRETLYVLHVQETSNHFEIATKLFGFNPLFGHMTHYDETSILRKLNNIGTLFIRNIHLLDQETQEHLAEFIKYGIYRVFKSDQKESSDVRIICSSNQNLENMVEQGTFSNILFEQLNKTRIALPSLMSLSEEELENLAIGFTQQAIQEETFKNLLELSDKEKRKLTTSKPASLQEFKNKVQLLLEKKSRQNKIQSETQFDPACPILSDADLAEAARLGKHALKNPKIMAMLFDKFKSQNKIATFLGVNRSSVNRRCKEYGL